jgi:hypothetical protein
VTVGDRDKGISRYEFELYREGIGRRLDQLEADTRAIRTEHGQDLDELTRAATDGRRWTWGQIVAISGAGIALIALWVQAAAAR